MSKPRSKRRVKTSGPAQAKTADLRQRQADATGEPQDAAEMKPLRIGSRLLRGAAR